VGWHRIAGNSARFLGNNYSLLQQPLLGCRSLLGKNDAAMDEFPRLERRVSDFVAALQAVTEIEPLLNERSSGSSSRQALRATLRTFAAPIRPRLSAVTPSVLRLCSVCSVMPFSIEVLPAGTMRALTSSPTPSHQARETVYFESASRSARARSDSCGTQESPAWC